MLRDGKVSSVATFTELENFEDPDLGKLECFITSGGLSTTPWSFEGKIKNLDYKTIRYPGHHAKFKLLLDLGLLSEDAVRVGAYCKRERDDIGREGERERESYLLRR